MRILVTGGLGFVGIHLVRWLAEKIPSAFIVVGDVQPVGQEVEQFLAPVRERLEMAVLDVRDRQAIHQVVQRWGVQAVIHAAAITPDDRQERQRMDWVMDVNLVGAINAISVAAQEPVVEQFLLVSSSGVYGSIPSGSTLMDEDSPQELNSLYTITKHSAELLTKRCGQLSGKRMTAVRLSAIYGEMERPAESRNRTSHVCRLLQALKEKRRVKVAGTGVSRDWLYAGDCAEAVRLLLLAPAWHYPVYNLGSGIPLSFGAMVEVFVKHGLQAEWIENLPDADISMDPGQARAVLDLQRIKQDTGFALTLNPAARLEWYLDHSIR